MIPGTLTAGLNRGAVTDSRSHPPPTPLPPLPPLRDDLILLPGTAERDGSPTWTIHDPVRQRFFRIDRVAFEALARWWLGDPERVAQAVSAETTATVTPTQISAVARFLRANELIAPDDPAGVESLTARHAAARRTWIQTLIHHYLSLRIPLVRPERFLTATLPLIEPLYSRGALLAFALLGIAGLWGVSRQWDSFLATFLDFFSLEGAAWYALALAVTKLVHEFGHAYTARRLGCRVPVMGVALLVLWPVLFTDTNDTWRLARHRQRVAVAAAGIIAELGLAVLATGLWCLLPDGPARSAAFLIATVSWITSLALNLSPFMRFDGYYLLSDTWGIVNLQGRAFALGRWWLRERLFGFGEAPPERFDPLQQRWLLIYAYTTWLYRAALFLGIAFLVYELFFKLLGLILLAIEIWWFLLWPVASELGQWWQRRRRIRINARTIATLIWFLALLMVLAAPWQTRVALPAVMRAANYATLFPPTAARLDRIRVAVGQPVPTGAILFELGQPQLDFQLAQIEDRIALLTTLIRRQAASGEGTTHLAVLREELATSLTSRDGLRAQLGRLTVRAPIDGVVAELAEALAPGRWVPAELPLARIVAPERATFLAYVSGADLYRIAPAAQGVFVPEDPTLRALPVTVSEIRAVNSPTLEAPALASRYGGPIAVAPETDQGLRPIHSQYRLLLDPAAGPPVPAPAQVSRGTIHLAAERTSLLGRLGRLVTAVLIRESGF